MAKPVDLMVVGVSDGKSRDELSKKLVREFGQPPQAFEPMLDAAFGDSGPYAAQSDVDRKLAEQGMQQLESFGLVCAITGVGEGYEPDAPSALAGAVAPASVTAIESDDASVAIDADDADEEIVELSSTFDPTAVEETDEADEEIASVVDEPASESESVAEEPASDSTGRTDVPDALSSASFDELEADLIDPAPVVKEKSAPVELDDGGLSISSDDSAPLTKPKAKSDPDAADDGGLSLVDAKRKLTMTSGDDDASDNSIGEIGAIEAVDDDLPSLDDLEESQLEISSVEAAPVEEPEAISGDLAKDLADDSAEESADDQVSAVAEEAPAEELSFGDLEDISLDDMAGEKDSAPAPTPDVVEDASAAATFDELDFDEPKTDDETSAAIEPAQLEAGTPEVAAPDGVEEASAIEPVDEPAVEAPSIQSATEKPSIEKAAIEEDSDDSISSLISDIKTKTDAPKITGAPEIAVTNAEGGTAPEITQDDAPEIGGGNAPSGLVLPGQPVAAVVPKITPSAQIDGETAGDESEQLALPEEEETVASAPEKDDQKSEKQSKDKSASGGKKKKIVAVAAGLAVVAGAGTFAFKQNIGGFAMPGDNSRVVSGQAASGVTDRFGSGDEQLTASTYGTSNEELQQASGQARASTLEDLTTEQLLTNLSVTSNESALVNLEPYFLESVDRARRGPQFGAAVPAESELLREIQNRVPHRADAYFDEWSDRESDLSLFLALLDNLIENEEYAVARQLSDRAKDKLFSVMSTQRLVRAYNTAGRKQELQHLMSLAARDTFMIKSAEERILAISDHAFTQTAIGNVDGSNDTFLKASILARTLPRPELKTVGLSSVARETQQQVILLLDI